jgi:hypothetical protein
MANKTFIGEEIFEFKPMGMAMPTDDPDNPGGSRPSPSPSPGAGGSPSPGAGGSRKPPMADPDASPAPGGPTGPGGAPEQAEGEDSTPEKSNTLTYLAIGLLALYFLRRK